MARDHARLDLHIWTDEDFRVLSTPAKLLYLHLISQPKLSYAGVLDLAPKRWARAHPDLGLDGVRAALAELDAARFVVIDQDTEELLVRSFIRRDELWKQPNVLRAALRVAFEIESPILRAALAAELRRLPADVTGPAPAVAARELGTAAPATPPSVKAALAARPRRATAPAAAPEDASTSPDEPTADADPTAPVEHVDPAETPSANPSGNPSPTPLGEGSGERETGVTPLTLRDQRGVPARVHAHTRETAEGQAHDTEPEPEPGPGPGPGSVRQRRRVEAQRLVTVHTPAQPRRVLDRLRAEVIGLLGDGVESAVIAAGLRVWSGKRLSVTLLPELVAERMRAHQAAAVKADDLDTVATFERVRAAVLADAPDSPLGRELAEPVSAHASPGELETRLREAGTRALAASAVAA